MKAFILSLLVILTCLCFYLLKRGEKKINPVIWFFYSLILIIAFYLSVSKVILVINHPSDWDFTAFYLYGKVAASGYNFYLPQNFHIVFINFQFPFTNLGGFISEVVNVGFPYPPPTILYFFPLGFLNFNTALLLWTLFILVFLFGSIYIVYDQFFKECKLNGLMLVLILFLISTPVRATIFYSQTNFILLFLLLLMKKYSDKKFSGIFLALAIFTKPYMIIFGLVFLLRKKWKPLFYAIFSSLVLIGITAIIFGAKPFMSYLFNNPAKRLPVGVFSEDINQSLQAVLLRHHLITMDKPIIYIYILIGALLLMSSYLFFYLLKRKLYDYIWAVVLLVGLMLYPGTLSHYGVLLLFIVFHFFNEKKQLGFKIYLNIPIIGIFFYLSSVSLFSCICFLLITIILKSYFQPKPYNPTLLNSYSNLTNPPFKGI